MPVRKYRDVSEMEGNAWREKGSPELLEAIRTVWALATATTRPRFPPGLHKHRSIEEANALQEDWDLANFEAYSARRRNEPSG